MSLRLRFALYALTIVGVVVLGLYLGASRVLLQSFDKLEKQQILESLERAEHVWEREAAHLANTATDYAAWDDTYTFIEDHNPAYIKDNLSSDALNNLNVNFFAFIDKTGKLIASQAVNLEWSVPIPLGESIETYLQQTPALAQQQSTRGRTSGLVVLPDTVLLAAAAPVITSDYQGPVRGSVVVGKFVDTRTTRAFSNLVQLEVKFYRLDNDALPQNVLAVRDDLLAQGGSLTQPLSEAQIAGYTLLPDLTGQPALLMQVEAPRAIYAQAQRSRRVLTALTLAAGLAATALLLVLLQRGILRRFARLSAAVEEIAESGDAGRRVALPGRDELARVGRDIDAMLASLGAAQESVRASEARYARAVEGVNDGLWDWNVETNSGYYSARFAAMLGYPEKARNTDASFFFNAVHPDDLSRVRRQLDEHLTGRTSQFESEFRIATSVAEPTDYRWMLCRGVARLITTVSPPTLQAH